jgi:hypothetical protein
MKKVILLTLLFFPFLLHAQFGVKAGVNFAKVSNASSINSSNKSGFNVGILLAPPFQKNYQLPNRINFFPPGL